VPSFLFNTVPTLSDRLPKTLKVGARACVFPACVRHCVVEPRTRFLAANPTRRLVCAWQRLHLSDAQLPSADTVARLMKFPQVVRLTRFVARTP
jgi:hypothetical protein